MTIWVDGLGIEARLRFPLMPFELLYAGYAWSIFRPKKTLDGLRLLVITQRVDAKDANLAVHVRWLREFAQHCKQVTVIAQSVGTHDLPSNVRVISLGKEKGAWKITQWLRLKRHVFFALFTHDAVLVLMVPLYAFVAGFWASFFRKPVYLWYTHKHVSLMLRLAMFFVRRVFTASKESFRLASTKVMVTGHAIDTEFFQRAEAGSVLTQDPLIVSIGRISPKKRLDVLIRVISVLRKRGKEAHLRIIGDVITDEDVAYAEELKTLVISLNSEQYVTFERGMAQFGVREVYQSNVIALNASATGSLDKSVLEAMSCGCFVITSNEAFRGIVPDGAYVKDTTPEAFADAIGKQLHQPVATKDALRSEVVEHHDLQKTLGKIIKTISSDVS
jgi:glycosyltransferase involved in cell wall biosynthesis